MNEVQKKQRRIEEIAKLSRNSDEWFDMVDDYFKNVLPMVKADAEIKMNSEIAWLQADIGSSV